MQDNKTLSWTREQQHVIESPPDERLLIDAGPGTGKTATACARIAWLLSHGGIEGSEVWLCSFTRTAVHELRNRIASYLDNPGDVAAIRISTIDSYAWALHSGFDSDASLTGSFDDNIRKAIELIQKHEGVFSYLSSVRHLIIDEAQDIVGPRCELLLEVINALPEEAGVSVFSDEAQAIYGFAEAGNHSSVDGTLPEALREFMSEQFCEHDLSKVHRTTDPTLLDVFTDGRKLIRNKEVSAAERLGSIRELVEQTNHGLVGPYWSDIKQLSEDDEDTLLLFRRRGEALSASGNLGARSHRLRMSGLPACIHGWIAVLLWDWTKPYLEADDFGRLWKERLGHDSNDTIRTAWSVLAKAFGRSDSRISMTQLVTQLSSSSPTYELTLPEFGYTGPIISTIHGSKGREASEVRLYLPRARADGSADDMQDEEARIAFVGATRARKTLKIGQSRSNFSRNLEPSNRAFTPETIYKGKKIARASVEIGRQNDVDAPGLVGRNLYESPANARTSQAAIMTLQSGIASLYAEATDKDHGWRFSVMTEDGKKLCYLNPCVGHDLFSIAKWVDQAIRLGKKRPPLKINHLRSFGIRTLAISPDDPVREKLHPPWCDSGLIAAPMMIGYPMVYFR